MSAASDLQVGGEKEREPLADRPGVLFLGDGVWSERASR